MEGLKEVKALLDEGVLSGEHTEREQGQEQGCSGRMRQASTCATKCSPLVRPSGGLPHAFKERAKNGMSATPSGPNPRACAKKMTCWRPDAEPKDAEPKGLGAGS